MRLLHSLVGLVDVIAEDMLLLKSNLRIEDGCPTEGTVLEPTLRLQQSVDKTVFNTGRRTEVSLCATSELQLYMNTPAQWTYQIIGLGPRCGLQSIGAFTPKGKCPLMQLCLLAA